MAGSATAGSKPTKQKQKRAPDGSGIVRVTCERGHPLRGLFVLWKIAPRAATSGTNGPGGSSQSPLPPPSPDAAICAVGDQFDPIPTEYRLGIVDPQGYLQPVTSDRNPWNEIFTKHNPRSWKLCGANEFSLCLVRHPHPRLARALRDYLNDPIDSPKDEFGFASWGAREDLVQNVLLVPDTTADKKPIEGQFVFQLPENDPGPYWPKGHSLYGKWLLYADMPHDDCKKVRDPCLTGIRGFEAST